MEEKSVVRSFLTSIVSNGGLNSNHHLSSMKIKKQEDKSSVNHLSNITSMWNDFAAFLSKKQIHIGGNKTGIPGSKTHTAILKEFAGFLVETGCVSHDEASGTLKYLSTALTVCAIDDYWIIDSGATDHMSYDLTIF